ncbi:MAG: C45 family autoproteolytic acyltransferase/hydrolase [Chloroflexi bacterium]|nr:C45 family autoproteolytic acyltransferase/hydrolase [Chloroflexota bacterium]
MNKIRLLTVKGTPYEMGFAHGRAYREDIRRYTEERVGLVCSGKWSGHELPRAEVLALAEACLPDHEAYAPELMEELRGLAAATDLSLAELLIVGGFTDFVDTVYNSYRQRQVPQERWPIDDCTAFIVPDGHTADGAGFFGQTWDMHDTATEFVILLHTQPSDGSPESFVFTTVGCVGQIGLNSAGIAIGINNLLGADGQIGVTWPFVVRKVLAQSNIEDALACITGAKLAGAHNYLLFDKTGRGFNIEAMSSYQHITPLEEENIVHTNHCLMSQTIALSQTRLPESQRSSEARLDKAADLLQERPITADHLMALTRDPEAICVRSKPPLGIETCGAAIMRPKTGDFWAVWGLPSENEYEHFKL